MSALLNLCNSALKPVDRAAEFTETDKVKISRAEFSAKQSSNAFKQNKAMRAPYCPIWEEDNKGPGRRVSNIKFEGGKRLKQCSIGKEWLPADTEHFGINKHTKIGMSSQCRECGRKKQRVVLESYKKSVK